MPGHDLQHSGRTGDTWNRAFRAVADPLLTQRTCIHVAALVVGQVHCVSAMDALEMQVIFWGLCQVC